MKQLLLDFLKRQGIHIARNSLPKGSDLISDLKRYGLDQCFDTLIDVGANVGNFSALFMESFPHLKNIVAIEPESKNLEKLNNRFHGKNVQCLGKAISDKEGVAWLNVCENAVAHSLIDQNWSTTAVEVNVMTLSQVIGGLPEDAKIFLKTDTEGNDVNVLKGGSDLLTSGRCPLVLCEVGFSDPPVQTQFQEVHSELTAYGFDLWGFYNQSIYGRYMGLNYCDALYLHRQCAEHLLSRR